MVAFCIVFKVQTSEDYRILYIQDSELQLAPSSTARGQLMDVFFPRPGDRSYTWRSTHAGWGENQPHKSAGAGQPTKNMCMHGRRRRRRTLIKRGDHGRHHAGKDEWGSGVSGGDAGGGARTASPPALSASYGISTARPVDNPPPVMHGNSWGG